MTTEAAEARVARSPRGMRWPWLSLTLVLAALVASSVPAGPEALSFQREAFESGELWRVLTMHLVHPWPRLALFDLTALLLFGLALESRSRAALAASGCAAALLAAVVVVLLRSDLESYQGASAIVAGWWAALAVDRLTAHDRGGRAVGALLLVACAGKTVAELAGFGLATAAVLPPGVERVGEAHLAGAVGGAMAAVAIMARAGAVSGVTQPLGRASSRGDAGAATGR